MPKCEFCGKQIDLPYRCNYCGGLFCEDHRLPPAHKCPNIELWRGREPPPRSHRTPTPTSYRYTPQVDNYVPVKRTKKRKAKRVAALALLLIALTIFAFNRDYVVYYGEFLLSELSEYLSSFSEQLSSEEGTRSLPEPKPPQPVELPTVPTPTIVFKPLKTGPETRELKYCYNGLVSSIPFTVYRGLKEYFAELPRTFICDPECPTDEEIYLRIINQPNQVEEIHDLIELIKILSPYKDEQARIAISLVQMIPYDYEKYFTLSTENWRYPYEVLYDYKGVCMEKSLLLAILLKELGFGVVLLVYEAENHMAVGIKCPGQYANYIYNGVGYCFVETTTPSIVTDMSGQYVGVGALKSKPKIIFVSDGMSFDAAREYKDAKEWQRLNMLANANNGYLNWEDYREWKEIAEKYCIVTED